MIIATQFSCEKLDNVPRVNTWSQPCGNREAYLIYKRKFHKAKVYSEY